MPRSFFKAIGVFRKIEDLLVVDRRVVPVEKDEEVVLL
jgi:hypothetical protein